MSEPETESHSMERGRLCGWALALGLLLICAACAPSPSGEDRGKRAGPESEPPDAVEPASILGADPAFSGPEPQPLGLPSPTVGPEHRLVAVSLRQLQVGLRRCHGAAHCPEDVLYLGGLTEVLGYVEDRKSRDVLLFGRREEGLPPIRSEDFAVALRNTWLKYAPVQSGTIIYSYPGCDIRPTGATLARLNAAGRRLGAAGMEGVEPAIEDWKAACREEQVVSVFGVPRDSHFSEVMVTADYHLKDITNGGADLDLPGLRSLTELHFDAAKEAALAEEPYPLASFNRFWLLAAEEHYEKAPGILMVDVPVRVATHQIGQDRHGELVDVEGRDPLAEEFTQDLSLLYDKLAGISPEYRELANLFQSLAVAKVLYLQRPHETVGLGLDYLLDDLPIGPVDVPARVPGRSSVERFSHREEMPDGYRELKLWMPSCGGVEMRVEPRPESILADRGGLEAIRDAVLSERPTRVALAWPVGIQPSVPAAAPLVRRRLRDFNTPGRPLVVRVRKEGARYQLFTQDQAALFQGPDVRELLRVVQREASAAGAGASYLVLQDFSDKDAAAFRATYEAQAPNVAPDLSVRSVNGIADTELERAVFERGLRLVEITSVQQDPETGWMKALVRFSVAVGRGIRTVTVVVLARTAELVDGFLERLHVEFSVYDNLPLSVAELLDRLQREYMREQGLNQDEFRILLQEQTRGIHWVWLARESGVRAA